MNAERKAKTAAKGQRKAWRSGRASKPFSQALNTIVRGSTLPLETGMVPVLRSKSGMRLDLWRGAIVRYIATPQVSQLTGLSIEKLREWTSRRALIPADVRPKRQGSPAKYTWQTVLLLLVAVTLRHRFRFELQAHRKLFSSLRRDLRAISFVKLWNKVLALHGGERWSLIDENGDLLLS